MAYSYLIVGSGLTGQELMVLNSAGESLTPALATEADSASVNP